MHTHRYGTTDAYTLFGRSLPTLAARSALALAGLVVASCTRGVAPHGHDLQVGTPAMSRVPVSLNPRAIGNFDLSKVHVVAFSQRNLPERDPQVLELAPDLVPRAWSQWRTSGLALADYDPGYPAACRANGTLFVGGLTASVLYEDEMDAKEFSKAVSRDASGAACAFTELEGAFRGSIASPVFRKLLIDIAKLQIDAGVDGVFFDEANTSFDGSKHDGNGGFDDAHVADFGRYLCSKYGTDPASLAEFDLVPADGLDCSSTDPGSTFDYRGYLARGGHQTAPLDPSNKLAAEWGSVILNRPDPGAGTFVETYSSLVYWQEIVVAVRNYAREAYNKEVLITSNGIFPFVDFQSVGLYPLNHDGPGGSEVDYVPATSARGFDGTVSLMPVLETLEARSKRVVEAGGGHEVPVLLAIDWPTPWIDRYYAFPEQQREDYIRMRLAEAYAYGMWFSLPLATTTDQNTASKLGMLGFFATLRDFYQAHADVVHGAKDSTSLPTVSVANVAAHLVNLDDGRSVIHLVNHNYAAGFKAQHAVTVQLPFARAPKSVRLASTDFEADAPAAFTYRSGTLAVAVGTLVSSTIVTIE